MTPKMTACPDCTGSGKVPACAITTCDRPSIGRCCMCRTEACGEDHGKELYGVVLCLLCWQTATVDRFDRAAKSNH